MLNRGGGQTPRQGKEGGDWEEGADPGTSAV